MQAVGEGCTRVRAEQRDHALVGPLAQPRRRNSGSIHVTARGVHRDAAVEASGTRPDEELDRVGRRPIDHAGPQLGGSPREVCGGGESLDGWRERVGGRRMVLGEPNLAHARGERSWIHRTVRAQHVHTRSNGKPTGLRPSDPTAAVHRLHCELAAQVRERDGHVPGAADRAGHDLVGARRLERVAHGHGVGADLETPHARAHFVEEVNPLPFIRRHRRRAVAGNTTQRDGVRGRRARRAGV